MYKAYEARFQPVIIFSQALKLFRKFNADTHKTNLKKTKQRYKHKNQTNKQKTHQVLGLGDLLFF